MYITVYNVYEDAEDKKTRVHPQTNNPRFDEIFAYPLTETELINKKMIVKVMDHDVLGRDDFLGEVIIDINTLPQTLKCENLRQVSGFL
jgi:Ca2+-dependent lipid-binding protein